MEHLPGRFAIVIHEQGYDPINLIIALKASGVTPLHVMPYEQWANTINRNDYDLFFLRNDGSWKYMLSTGDRSDIAS